MEVMFDGGVCVVVVIYVFCMYGLKCIERGLRYGWRGENGGWVVEWCRYWLYLFYVCVMLLCW